MKRVKNALLTGSLLIFGMMHEVLATFPRDVRSIRAISDPENNMLVVSTLHQFHFYKLENGKWVEIDSLRVYKSFSSELSPDGNLFAVSNQNSSDLFKRDCGNWVNILHEDESLVEFKFSFNSNMLIFHKRNNSQFYKNELNGWSKIPNLRLYNTLPPKFCRCNKTVAAITYDTDRLVFGPDEHRELKLYEIADCGMFPVRLDAWCPVFYLQVNDGILNYDFSPTCDELIVLACNQEDDEDETSGFLKFYGKKNGLWRYEPILEIANVYFPRFSEDGQRFVVQTRNEELFLYIKHDGDWILAPNHLCINNFHGYAFFPDGQKIVVLNKELDELQLFERRDDNWSLAATFDCSVYGKKCMTFNDSEYRTRISKIDNVVFFPDGTHVISATFEGCYDYYKEIITLTSNDYKPTV